MTDEHEVGLAGDWSGVVDIPEAPLTIRLHIDPTATSGTLDVPDQLAVGLPLGELSENRDGAVRFTVAAVPGSPLFTGRRDGASIVGVWSQAGQDIPCRLGRGTAASTRRPQNPLSPVPYRQEEFTVSAPGATLAGTLTLPDIARPGAAVVMITGSGAHDRDETVAGHKPFLVMADALARAGIAALRVDDRGVGGSTGARELACYEELIADVRACVAALAARPDLDERRIGLLGHSEGGYLAPLVARRARAGEIATLALLATPAVPGEDVLSTQTRAILQDQNRSAAEIDKAVEHTRALVALLRRDDLDGARSLAGARIRESSAARLTDEQLDLAVRSTLAPLRNLATYDPAAALRALKIPTLAVYGDKDLQVPADVNAAAMRAHLASDPDCQVTVLNGLNHLLQPASTGAPREYADIDLTTDPVVLTLLVDWFGQYL